MPIGATGRGSSLFTGVMDNTDIFFKVMRVALGDNKIRKETMSVIGNPHRGGGSRKDVRERDHDHDDDH